MNQKTSEKSEVFIIVIIFLILHYYDYLERLASSIFTNSPTLSQLYFTKVHSIIYLFEILLL